jgi:hypothetical protein
MKIEIIKKHYDFKFDPPLSFETYLEQKVNEKMFVKDNIDGKAMFSFVLFNPLGELESPIHIGIVIGKDEDGNLDMAKAWIY